MRALGIQTRHVARAAAAASIFNKLSAPLCAARCLRARERKCLRHQLIGSAAGRRRRFICIGGRNFSPPASEITIATQANLIFQETRE